MKQNRNTPAKLAIEELLELSNTALSHQDIQKALGNICNRVTIYRVLNRLLEEEKIHKIVDVDGISKYATCHHYDENHKHNHVHFSCTECHSVICLEELEPNLNVPEGYQVNEMNFMMSGLCPDCS